MADVLRINTRVAIPTSELKWRFSRSGGPGGQGVNTSDSRVELSFDVGSSPSIPPFLRQRALQRLEQRLIGGIVTIHSSEHRSQFQNRRAAELRLVALLAEAFSPPRPPRRPTRPSLSAKRRRVDEKKHRGEIKRNRRPPID